MAAAVGLNGSELQAPQYPTQFAVLPTAIGTMAKGRIAASVTARTIATAQGLSFMSEKALGAQQPDAAEIPATAAQRTLFASQAVAPGKELQAAVAKARQAKDPKAKAAATVELEKLAALCAVFVLISRRRTTSYNQLQQHRSLPAVV